MCPWCQLDVKSGQQSNRFPLLPGHASGSRSLLMKQEAGIIQLHQSISVQKNAVETVNLSKVPFPRALNVFSCNLQRLPDIVENTCEVKVTVAAT